MKFHKNRASGSRVVPYGRTDMTKLIVAFLNYAHIRGSLKAAVSFYIDILWWGVSLLFFFSRLTYKTAYFDPECVFVFHYFIKIQKLRTICYECWGPIVVL